jgi:hypothetical protein
VLAVANTRLKLRVREYPDLPHDISWQLFDQDDRERTSGFGSLHLGNATMNSLRELSAVTYGARRVNNRFGEGASPRLRQIREGLEALGLESSHFLHHATPRLFCASEVEPKLVTIASAWRRRWLLNRIQSDDVLDRVGKLGPESVRAELWADEGGQFKLPLE